MKRLLQIAALVVALSGIALWAAKGANIGWTKTGKEVRTLDEVTGIEGISYEKGFWPGIDFLGGALIGAGVLGGVSLLIRNKPTTH
jgi:hypothetical protein